MKNMAKILATIAAVFLVGSATAQVAVEKVAVSKTGGKQYLGKFGYHSYEKKVNTEEWRVSGIPYYEINCKGEGAEACRFDMNIERDLPDGELPTITVHGLEFDETIFFEHYNKLLDKVDARLKKGEASGKIEEEIFLEYQGRKSDIRVRFTAIWENGNRNGDALIALIAEDIAK